MSERLDPPKRRARQSEDVHQQQTQPSQKAIKPRKWGNDILTLGGMDIPFFALVMALVTIGLIMLFSATYPYALYKQDSSYYFFKRQLAFTVVGVFAMLGMSKINYRLFKRFLWIIFFGTLGLLGLVLVYHTNVGDFKRWIPLGPITIQPSDIAKFTIVLVLADYISKNHRHMKEPVAGIVIPILIIGLFCGLIFLEHHNSGTILVFCIGATLMFCGGSNWKLFVLGAAVVAAVVFFVITNPDVLMKYAGERIEAWLNKDFDPLGARWQTNNSLYAIGSGGIFGAGLGNSKQKFLYVSEPQNDFIFSIVCEELGFIGAAIIILIFALLFLRGIQIAIKCNDRFGALLVIGIVSQVAIQTIFNILVVTDTIPNTGIALPFFSYGGTSVLMLLFEMGVVLSVSRKSNQQNI